MIISRRQYRGVPCLFIWQKELPDSAGVWEIYYLLTYEGGNAPNGQCYVWDIEPQFILLCACMLSSTLALEHAA